MGLYWRLKMWWGSMVGKVFGLIFLAILVVAIIFAIRNLDAIMKTLDDLMSF